MTGELTGNSVKVVMAGVSESEGMLLTNSSPLYCAKAKPSVSGELCMEVASSSGDILAEGLINTSEIDRARALFAAAAARISRSSAALPTCGACVAFFLYEGRTAAVTEARREAAVAAAILDF